jgi:hypothetical protein
MHSFPAVEDQPVNNLIFGLAPCFKAHVVKSLNLQRAEKRFRHRIVASLTLTGS